MGRRKASDMPDKDKTAFQLEQLAAIGVTQEDAASILGFSVDYLYRHFAPAWKEGKAKATAKVAQKLFEKCMSGDRASIFFWLKTQAGWREVQQVDHTSSDGSMKPGPAVSVNLSDLSPQQVAEMARAAFTGEADD